MQKNYNLNITAEQEKALLTQFVSVEAYLQQMIDNRSWKIMQGIIKDYAIEKFELEPLSEDEQKILDDTLKGRFVFSVDKLNKAVNKIIVMKSKVKSIVDKIKEQEEAMK